MNLIKVNANRTLTRTKTLKKWVNKRFLCITRSNRCARFHDNVNNRVLSRDALALSFTPQNKKNKFFFFLNRHKLEKVLFSYKAVNGAQPIRSVLRKKKSDRKLGSYSHKNKSKKKKRRSFTWNRNVSTRNFFRSYGRRPYARAWVGHLKSIRCRKGTFFLLY